MPVKLKTNVAALNARRPEILAFCDDVLNSPSLDTNTDRLLDLLNVGTNARLTHVARSLVGQLHEFACKKKLRTTELMAAVDLVCDLSRPGRFLLLTAWLTWALQGRRLRCPPR